MIRLRQEDVEWTEKGGRIVAPDGRVMTHSVGPRALITQNLEADLNYYMDKLAKEKAE
jgi:hypothetical protein